MNHSSDIDFKDFLKIYKKCTSEPYSFLVNDATLASDNSLRFDDQIRDEKLQYNIYREAAKISALSSNKFNKFEYLTGNEILSSNQQQIIEQAKFTYYPLGNAFERQIKTIENQEEHQVEASRDLNPKEQTKAIEGISNNQLIATNIFKISLKKERA